MQAAAAYRNPLTVGTPFKNKLGAMTIEFDQWKNRPDRRGADQLHADKESLKAFNLQWDEWIHNLDRVKKYDTMLNQQNR